MAIEASVEQSTFAAHLLLLFLPSSLSLLLQKLSLLLRRHSLQLSVSFLFLHLLTELPSLLLGLLITDLLQLLHLGLAGCIDFALHLWAEMRVLSEIIGKTKEGLEKRESARVVTIGRDFQ